MAIDFPLASAKFPGLSIMDVYGASQHFSFWGKSLRSAAKSDVPCKKCL